MKTNCFKHSDTNNGTVTLSVRKLPVTVMKFCESCSVCNLGVTGGFFVSWCSTQVRDDTAWRQQTPNTGTCIPNYTPGDSSGGNSLLPTNPIHIYYTCMKSLFRRIRTRVKLVEEKQLLDGISLLSNTLPGNPSLHTILW
jgi:hypothetical protein